ncbi:MAG: leucine-rich repeat domain-containing protein [Clostridia bacterium]|nr:leucine-rich repeat domain-containing protein [Clostridia bacterium]
MLHEGKHWIFDDEANVLQIKDGVEEISWDIIQEFSYGKDMYNYKEFEVILPNTVCKIGDGAFSHVKLAKIIIPDSVTWIGQEAFFDAAYLKDVSISSKTYSIRSGAFQFCCKLKKVKIPEGVREISFRVFKSCRSLTKVALPTTIKDLEHDSFYYCDNLKELYVPKVIYKNCKSFFEKYYPNIVIPYENSIDEIILDDSDDITEMTNTNHASTDANNKSISFNGVIRKNLIANKKKK